jgi:DNA-binding transcriptional MerR regulator
MRISELSERSGVATATIKFYLRERLLAAGELSSPNQASYSDAHLARLRLIRALIDVGGLSVPGARAVLDAIDDERMPLDWAFGVAQRALPRAFGSNDDAATDAAATDAAAPDGHGAGAAIVDGLIRDAGLSVSDENPGRGITARVLDRFEAVGHPELFDIVPAYLRAALIVAEADLDSVDANDTRARKAETVVVGTVLGDSLLAGLRRIAQEHVSHRRNPVPPELEDDEFLKENCT